MGVKPSESENMKKEAEEEARRRGGSQETKLDAAIALAELWISWKDWKEDRESRKMKVGTDHGPVLGYFCADLSALYV